MKYTEKEKKVVENIKEILSFNLKNPFLDDETDNIEILLNLIEKQQKEIERLEERSNYYEELAGEYQGSCIPKDVIRKKINQLHNGKISVEVKGEKIYEEVFDNAARIEVLNELLGDE